MDFYNANQSRRYPLVDWATLLSDSGEYAPTGLLVDMSFAVDQIHGNGYYVSAISKRGVVCTVVISSIQSRLPLGTATVNLDSVFFRRGQSPQVEIKSILDSAINGTVVFGERFAEIADAVYMFNNVLATTICPRAVFPVAIPSDQRFAVFRSISTLSGNVTLSQDGDIEIVFEHRQLGDKLVPAIVFRLKDTSNSLVAYAESQQRPEANTCESGRILTINGLQPDCCGRLFFEFRGCAQITKITNHCGVVLECPVAIGEICPPGPDYGEVIDIDECTGSAGGGIGSISMGQEDSPEYDL